MMGCGMVISAKIEIDLKIFREMAINFSSSTELQTGNSFVDGRRIIFMSVPCRPAFCLWMNEYFIALSSKFLAKYFKNKFMMSII